MEVTKPTNQSRTGLLLELRWDPLHWDAVFLTRMTAPSPVQTEQYSDKESKYTAFILISCDASMNFSSKIT